MATWLVPRAEDSYFAGLDPMTIEDGDLIFNTTTDRLVIGVRHPTDRSQSEYVDVGAAQIGTTANSVIINDATANTVAFELSDDTVLADVGGTLVSTKITNTLLADNTIALNKIAVQENNQVLVTDASGSVTVVTIPEGTILARDTNGNVTPQKLRPSMVDDNSLPLSKLPQVNPGQVLGVATSTDTTPMNVGPIDISSFVPDTVTVTSGTVLPSNPSENDMFFYCGQSDGDQARLYMYVNSVWTDVAPALINTSIGPTGPAGMDGMDGAGITTVTPTTEASGDILLEFFVDTTSVGTATIPVGSIMGPTGATGPTGPRGAQGEPGPMGSDGDAGEQGPQGRFQVQAYTQALVSSPPATPTDLTWTESTNTLSGTDSATWSLTPPTLTGSNVLWETFVNYDPATDTGTTTGPWASPFQAGSQGPTGPAGPQGDQGPVGPMGPTGPAGPTGPQGAQGPIGPTGPAGRDGTNGMDGAEGVEGPEGPTGPTGPAGPQGDRGPTGPTGPQGEQGMQGPIGPTGPAGPAGMDGDDGAAGMDGATGPTGPQGPAGPTGPTGPAGSQGAAGPQGPQGSFLLQAYTRSDTAPTMAPTGGSFDEATNTLTPPTTTEPGITWAAMIPAGSGRLYIVEARYDPSAEANSRLGTWSTPFEAGAQGPAGPAGPAGADGMDGMDGMDGATGPQGAQGPTGPTGPTGPQGAQGPAGTNGMDGAAGAAGAPTVVWYASDATGTDATTTFDAALQFIAFNNTADVAPDAFTRYVGMNGMNGMNGADGSRVTVSQTAPIDPSEGDLWYYEGGNAGTANQQPGLYIYYTDSNNASQWISVDAGDTGGGSGGDATFVSLTDTPDALGTAGQIVQVNSAGDALEFADASGGGGGGYTPPTSGTFMLSSAIDVGGNITLQALTLTAGATATTFQITGGIEVGTDSQTGGPQGVRMTNPTGIISGQLYLYNGGRDTNEVILPAPSGMIWDSASNDFKGFPVLGSNSSGNADNTFLVLGENSSAFTPSGRDTVYTMSTSLGGSVSSIGVGLRHSGSIHGTITLAANQTVIFGIDDTDTAPLRPRLFATPLS